MSDHDSYEFNARGHGESQPLYRIFTGMLLVVIGVVTALGLIITIVNMIGATTPPTIVRAVTPSSPIVFGMPEGQFTLPPDLFTPIGYLIVCFMLAILAGIAAGLINGGVSLLGPDITSTLKKLVAAHQSKR